jgi:hypothetical protein
MSDAFLKQTRADLLERFIQLEVTLNKIIAAYYLGGQQASMFVPFQMQVLQDGNCSFALKRNILRKILRIIYPEGDKQYRDNFQTLIELNKIRNLYAHCGGQIVYKPDGAERIIFTPDPERPEKRIDFTAKYKQFQNDFQKVDVWLWELFEQMPVASQQAAQRFRDAINSNLNASGETK